MRWRTSLSAEVVQALFDPLEPLEDVGQDVAVDEELVAVEEPFPVALGDLGDLGEHVPGDAVAFVVHDGVAGDVEFVGEVLLGEAGADAGFFDPCADGFFTQRGHPERGYGSCCPLSAIGFCAQGLHRNRWHITLPTVVAQDRLSGRA